MAPKFSFFSNLLIFGALFFLIGFVASFNEVINPFLRSFFDLSYSNASLIQFSFFITYLFLAMPSGYVIRKYGHMKIIYLGLFFLLLGCVSIIFVSSLNLFWPFLVSILFIAFGSCMVIVSSNSYVSFSNSASHLTIANSFYMIGTSLGPLFIGNILFSSDKSELILLQFPYSMVSLMIILAVALLLKTKPKEPLGGILKTNTKSDNWVNTRLVLGSVAVFLYVGVEVSAARYMVDFFTLPHLEASITTNTASKFLSLYWFIMLIGRLTLVPFLKNKNTFRFLMISGIFGILIVFFVSFSSGITALISVVLLGLANAIMFPSIFHIALRDSSGSKSLGSGLLMTSVIGGAIFPIAQGYFADLFSLQSSYLLMLISYIYIVIYASTFR